MVISWGQSFSLLLHCTITTEYYKKGRLNEQENKILDSDPYSLFGSYSPIIAPLTQVHATEYNDVITSVGVENRSGEALTQGLDIWQEFRLTADFVLPDNTVHEGDTTNTSIAIRDYIFKLFRH